MYTTLLDYFTIYHSPLNHTERRQFLEQFNTQEKIFDMLCSESNNEMNNLRHWCIDKKKRYAFYVWAHAVMYAYYNRFSDCTSPDDIDQSEFIYNKALSFERDYNKRIAVPKSMFKEVMNDTNLPQYDVALVLERWIGPILEAVGI